MVWGPAGPGRAGRVVAAGSARVAPREVRSRVGGHTPSSECTETLAAPIPARVRSHETTELEFRISPVWRSSLPQTRGGTDGTRSRTVVVRADRQRCGLRVPSAHGIRARITSARVLRSAASKSHAPSGS
jgi:hypothetical protein